MTERTWLISYLSYGRFGVILKMNTIKKTRPHLKVKKYRSARIFLSVIEKIVILCHDIFVAFVLALVAFTQNLKEP